MSRTFGQRVRRIERQRTQPVCTCGFGYRRSAEDWYTCAECGGRLRSDEEIEDARRDAMEERYDREDARREAMRDRNDRED